MNTIIKEQNHQPSSFLAKAMKIIFWLVMIIIAAFVVGGTLATLFPPSSNLKTAPVIEPKLSIKTLPEKIKALSDNIISVNEISKNGNKELKIDYKMASGYVDASLLFIVSNEIRDVLQKIRENSPDLPANRIDFDLVAGLQDNYGNAFDRPIIAISWDMADIKKINFDSKNFTGWNLLSLANPVRFLHPVGKKIIYSYCKDPENVEYTGNFCTTSIISGLIDGKQ